MVILDPPVLALWSRLRDAFGHALTTQLDRSLTHAPGVLAQIVAAHPELYQQVGRTCAIHWTQLASWSKTEAATVALLERFRDLAPLAGLTSQAALDRLLLGAVVLITPSTVPVVQRLLAWGASPNVPHPANQGRTALGQAATQPQGEAVIAALLAAGADPEAPNALGHTPLQEATQGGHLGPVLALVRAGATLDRPDPLTHRTPRQMLQERWAGTHEAQQLILAEQARIAPFQAARRRRTAP